MLLALTKATMAILFREEHSRLPFERPFALGSSEKFRCHARCHLEHFIMIAEESNSGFKPFNEQ